MNTESDSKMINFSDAALGDHVNVRRPFQSTDDLMSKSYHGVHGGSRGVDTCIMSQSMISGDNTDNRSIEHSLALIRQHVKVIHNSYHNVYD